jgi:hypothetical protein
VIPDEFACGAFSLINEQDYQKSGLYAGIPARFLKLRNRDELVKSYIYNK